MASKKHQCVQNDSFAYDYTPKSGITLDSDWTGSWAIVNTLGTGRTTLSSGTLTKGTNDAWFEMRIAPVDTGMAVGDYYLVVQVTNTVIAFNKEIVQDIFEVTKQGI